MNLTLVCNHLAKASAAAGAPGKRTVVLLGGDPQFNATRLDNLRSDLVAGGPTATIFPLGGLIARDGSRVGAMTITDPSTGLPPLNRRRIYNGAMSYRVIFAAKTIPVLDATVAKFMAWLIDKANWLHDDLGNAIELPKGEVSISWPALGDAGIIACALDLSADATAYTDSQLVPVAITFTTQFATLPTTP